MSGLKINYTKCEIILLNIIEAEGHHFSYIFGCNVGDLSISYLGIPLHWKNLTVSN
jgi:hypothetical protein